MVFVQDGVYFQVDDKGTLMTMSNPDQVPKDVVIPKATPCGHPIQRLGTKFCFGSFSKITVSDEIEEIGFGAFQFCEAKEIIWPSSCKVVPDQCFAFSFIKKISNMTDIRRMGSSAFAYSDIREVTWPSTLEEIPYRCFAGSSIRKVLNTDCVSRVCAEAFVGSQIETFYSFADTVDIQGFAFGNACFLNEVNLSSSVVCFIKDDAFCRADKCKLHLPYYSEE